ncbi:MAG: DUF4290 domain-containing protein [Bacteroidales bacterium OttesenSCG-928-I14]|jgi:hypothetical protein|nr:DUF4290 domain-containing protein [Bacteroidales bacterium OttesenSCG-928-I14]
MVYNTKKKPLNLPEYGRNIQNMVNYCVSIKEKVIREKYANNIVNIMGNMFPHFRNVNNFKHILWDHLAIMSDFLLDIDYPYEVIKKDDLYIKPLKLPYLQSHITYKYYGKNVEKMICEVAKYVEGTRKDRIINLLAIYMKRSFLIWNKEKTVEDFKIFDDIKYISKGSIVLDKNKYKLVDVKNIFLKKIKNKNII